jgi:hypothetical protein
MNRDYLITACVFAGVAALFAALIARGIEDESEFEAR